MLAAVPPLQGWRSSALTEQSKSVSKAGTAGPEKLSMPQRIMRFGSRVVRRFGHALTFIRTLAFRVMQGAARLFGQRVVLLSDVGKISMLGVPVLKRLRQAAAEGEGGILEVGPYVGGSTIAFALGHKGRRKHVVVEIGGSNENPHLPSSDIILDLKRNLKRFGCEEWVTIVQGWSNYPAVIDPAMEATGPIGIFFFDANGEVAEQLSICAKHFRDDCVIILDDLVGDHVKAEMVVSLVDRFEKSGVFVNGEMVEGTWFGRLGTRDRDVFAHYPHEMGHAWLMPAPDPARWSSELLEDGQPLGPACAIHVDIRERGLGAWSHWNFGTRSYALFSTSDNSDPNENGRKYELKVTPR